MIVSFKCPETEALANGFRVKRFVNIAVVARRKIRQLEVAGRIDDLRVPREIDSNFSKATGQDNTVFELTINGVFVFVGLQQEQQMLRSLIIIRES